MVHDKDSYNRIFDNLYDGLYFVDTDRVITYWNKAAERLTGYKAEEVVGHSCSDNILMHVDVNGTSLCHGMCPLAMTMADGESRESEVYLHHKDGHRVPVSVRVSPMLDSGGEVIGGIELFSDISNVKYIETRMKELEEMAMMDNLTRLANRNYIEKEMSLRLEENKRYDVPFGIIFLDIDHFKKFNDTYGHDVGDLVLKYVAETLVKNSRPFDVIGRWGGEEFIGIMRNIEGEYLKIFADRLRMLIESSYIKQDENILQVTVSMGVTNVHIDDNIKSIIKRADNLLYKSKNNGRNRITMG
ncbi:MAG: GGDEF domain-containing protein [Spirochaetes bacterium]|nr:GGDEF domain-containing protein [Spirochaetota bacterium]